MRAARSGFTLAELLIVITIILILTIAAIPAVLLGLQERRVSEAARTLQAAFAGARDKAIVDGQVRGLRLIREDTDPWNVSTLVYIGVSEPYSVGTVSTSGKIVTADPAIDPHWETTDRGPDGQAGRAGVDDDGNGVVDDNSELGWPGSDDIPRVDRSGQSYIRFSNAGRMY